MLSLGDGRLRGQTEFFQKLRGDFGGVLALGVLGAAEPWSAIAGAWNQWEAGWLEGMTASSSKYICAARCRLDSIFVRPRDPLASSLVIK